MVAQFLGEGERIGFFVVGAQAVAGVPAAMTRVQADGADFASANRARGIQKGAQSFVGVELGDQRGAVGAGNRKAEADGNAVDFGICRIDEKDGAEVVIGGGELLPPAEPGELQTIGLGPVGDGHITVAVDEGSLKPAGHEGQPEDKTQQNSIRHGSASCPPISQDSREMRAEAKTDFA